jgi:DNA-binding MurR/RpiR family transcriptional regulator
MARRSTFFDTKILWALEREPFHSARSLAEAVGVSYSTIIRHMRDSLGIDVVSEVIKSRKSRVLIISRKYPTAVD